MTLFTKTAIAFGTFLFGGSQIQPTHSLARTYSATLTRDNPSSSIASISLIDNDSNNLETSCAYQCTQSNYESFCLELTIYNTDCKGGIDDIKISIYGDSIDGNANLYSMLSYDNDYISLLTDWNDAGLKVTPFSGNGGVFVAPQCGSNELLQFNEYKGDIINNFWDSMSGSTNKWDANRIMANNNNGNWQHLTSKINGKEGTPVRLNIKNDLVSNTLTTMIGTDNIRFEDTMCMYNKAFNTLTGNNYRIGLQSNILDSIIEFTKFEVEVTCTPPNGGNPPPYSSSEEEPPTKQPTEEPEEPMYCEYTHKCQATGDPHITTSDGTLYHFQGIGYFDYLRACTFDDASMIPVTISARQDKAIDYPGTSQIGEVIVSIADPELDSGYGSKLKPLQIKFPSNSGRINGVEPTFIHNDKSAVGNYALSNGKYEVQVTKNGKFEILFPMDNDIYQGNDGRIKLSYQGTTLIIETSDCLSDMLCGLCGKFNNDPNDDFTRCDDLKVIDNNRVSAPWSESMEIAKDARRRVKEFGESCCRKDFDETFLGISDCTVEETEDPSDCIDSNIANLICENAWKLYCGNCNCKEPSEEWLVSCAYDMCLNKHCEAKIFEDIALGQSKFSVSDAKNLGCLDTTIDECNVNCPDIIHLETDNLRRRGLAQKSLEEEVELNEFFRRRGLESNSDFELHPLNPLPGNYDKKEECNSLIDEMMNDMDRKKLVALHRWKSSNANTMITTLTSDELEGDSMLDGSGKWEYKEKVGKLITSDLSDLLVPIYSYYNSDITQFIYTDSTTNDDELSERGYTYKQLEGYMSKYPCFTFFQPLYQYKNKDNGDSAYTMVNLGTSYSRYVKTGIVGYIVPKEFGELLDLNLNEPIVEVPGAFGN